MKLLFICTHNRCRSILGEAVARDVGLEAASAGSQPVAQVHPLSLQYLAEAGIDCSGLRSQSWDQLESFAPDVVITVCDSAAGESCPLWMGESLRVHWGLADPSRLAGECGDDIVADAFRQTIALLQARLRLVTALSVDDADRDTLLQSLVAIAADHPAITFSELR